MQDLEVSSPRGASAPPLSDGPVRYLDALDIFTRGDLDAVRALAPRWMAAYTHPSAGDPLITSCTPLHLAVQCPRKDVIAALLATQQVPVDAVDAQGMTALHLAAKAARKDVVRMLLRHGADDMVLDAGGQDALAYAGEADVAAAIQDHRAETVRSTTARLLQLARDKDIDGVKALLADPASASRVNVAVRDPDDGGSLLHVAVRSGLLDLARWAITEGVDVFAVDKAGNQAGKYATDHGMRELLSQAPMGSVQALMGGGGGRAPKFSGELLKWTNYAGGWKARWLELDDGVLSYYKNRADADSACRGAINLRIAKIVMPKESPQFEVLGKGSIRYRLKAADAQLAKQWVHLLNVSKQWALETHSHKSPPSTAAGDAGPRARASSLLRTDGASAKSAHARGASTSSSEIVPTSPYVRNATTTMTPGTEVSRIPSMVSSPSDNESDDDESDGFYVARDTFFTTLAELRSQVFIQDRLLDGLGSKGSGVPLLRGPEERAQYLSIAEQTSGQSRVLLDALDRAYRASVSAWQTRLRREQERIDMLADSLRAAIVSSESSARQPVAGMEPTEEEEVVESDSDFADASEEFFDAVASTTTSLLLAPGTVDDTETVAAPETIVDPTALSGYPANASIRCTLPEITTGGPSLNLWSVIKGAIGKDLSKISVPVFFNEPTSFLQRFTEDMEYCDLLELATRMPRSQDRTLFVAGFAMSNYASTWGRIAKPFNPLLGETFEYVRRDKKYRAVSEQVEHHPPISACWVEGPRYVYHADTNIKSKFAATGSLTVVPTGVCHVELHLPLAFLKDDDGEARQPPRIIGDYFVEHYTWNKLTTNVNGIMIANFWIEHVGDLDVVNHRTGDRTTLTFMPAGWTGKNKFKVAGVARNRRNEPVYDVSGDWTSKLVAKPIGSNASTAAEDIIESKGVVELPRRPFVLWKINERQMEGNTYHLTTYAMSLNDRPTCLEPFLCPTDSRFRPDQRAMETGAYELADREKSRLENKQRATRRRRELGELPKWKPRWFVRDEDPDSGESFWKFNDEYWVHREAAKEGKGWENVEDIF
ncbi:hypothetical protein GGI20_004883 [Coemansia sp. BCRC 34301]|nr:hypothetical protein GGI20_004883 [Coemansia sp. BCRC 34301]